MTADRADRTDGRRRTWVALPIDDGREEALYARWGWCGPALWTAFLQACKRSQIEGRVPFRSEQQLASDLRVAGRPLVDAAGRPFTLAEFFHWTGRQRWTRRHRGSYPAFEHVGWDEYQRSRPRPTRQPQEATRPAPDLKQTSNRPSGNLRKPSSAAGNVATNNDSDRDKDPRATTGGSFVPLTASTEQDRSKRTNDRPARPAYSEPGTWTPEKREAWITAKVDEIRRTQGDKAATAYLNKITAEDLTLERARLQSGDSPADYRPFLPKWAEDGPPLKAAPDPEPCDDCPEVATG